MLACWTGRRLRLQVPLPYRAAGGGTLHSPHPGGALPVHLTLITPFCLRGTHNWVVPDSLGGTPVHLLRSTGPFHFLMPCKRPASLMKERVGFQWTPQADATFRKLYVNFTSALILTDDLLLRWPLQMLASVRSCPSALARTTSSTPVLFSPAGSPLLRETTMWATGNCWLSKWHWRNGSTDWEGQSIPSWCGLNTRIWSTFFQPEDSIPGRPGGLFFQLFQLYLI